MVGCVSLSRLPVTGADTSMDVPKRQYSTGLQFLDRRIDGGIHAGTLLVITAPPESQSELLLRQFLQTHQTTYISTVRPAAEVEAWAAAARGTAPNLTVSRESPETLLTDFESYASQITPESFVIIDPTNGLETASRAEYLALLDIFKTALQRTDSVGVLHCPATTPLPPQRDLTLSRADQIWQINLMTLSREIKTRLLVTKSRYGRALREPIDLMLTDRVEVDTSRRIS